MRESNNNNKFVMRLGKTIYTINVGCVENAKVTQTEALKKLMISEAISVGNECDSN